MEGWKFAQKDPTEALALLHFFSVTKKHASGEIEARITVKEFANAKTTDMKFLCEAEVVGGTRRHGYFTRPVGGGCDLVRSPGNSCGTIRNF